MLLMQLPELINVFGIIFVADFANPKHAEEFDFKDERDVGSRSLP